jgi:hypothetical protein
MVEKRIKSKKREKLIKAILNGPTLDKKRIKEWERDLEKMRGKCE